MDACPHALYHHLATDLERWLPTLSGRILFDSNVEKVPWPGVTPSEVSCLWLLNSLLKKFEDEKAKDADNKALQKFLASNDRCRDFCDDASTHDELSAIIHGEFDKCLHDTLEPVADESRWFDMDFVLDNMRTGPGASVGASGNSYYHKVCNGPMSTTHEALYARYKAYLQRYDLESDVENTRFDIWGDRDTVVQGSNLSFAFKNSDISRVICTEPSLNMMFQQGYSRGLEVCLAKSFGIDLQTQPAKNRELALVGSRDGTFGTADLSSASDSTSCNLIRDRFPKFHRDLIFKIRSPAVKLPVGFHQLETGSRVQLQMISSMGNGFTFALETLIFACVVKAVYTALSIEFVPPRGETLGNFAVFGDDIIVRREAYDRVVMTLEQLGYQVNISKSFNEGPFRESCGADLWLGHNVRGIYARSLRTPQRRYTLINRLSLWSKVHGIPLANTLEYLRKSVWLIPVPPWDNEDAGLRMPWVEALEVFGVNRATIAGYHDHNGSVLYERYIPEADTVSLLRVKQRPFCIPKWDKVKDGKTVFCKVPHNHSGILLSAVNGSLRDGNLAQKLLSPRYQKRVGVAPCWDYDNASASLLSKQGWQRWVTSSDSAPFEGLNSVVAFVAAAMEKGLEEGTEALH